MIENMITNLKEKNVFNNCIYFQFLKVGKAVQIMIKD